MFETVEQIEAQCRDTSNYICDTATATAILLAYKLQKPLLVEGEPGVGKTELAKVIAAILQQELIRLQCYEGIDETHILYEWAYAKQLLYAEILRGKINDFLSDKISLEEAIKKVHMHESAFFSEEFLESRPLLKALRAKDPVVLLIDEIDRSDRETEAFLLEALSDFQVSIPEIGTIKAIHKPFVIITSNNTRELSDALKRRCIYLYIDLPSFTQELAIIKLKVPGISDLLAQQIVIFVQKLRAMDLKKIPSIAETIDWARVLVSMNIDVLDPTIVTNTINVLLKHKNDLKKSTRTVRELVSTTQKNSVTKESVS